MSASMKLAKMRTTGYGRGYAGDPGLFGFLGKAIGGIAKVGLGIAKSLPGVGSVVTGVTGGLSGLLSRKFGGAPAPVATTSFPMSFSPAAAIQMQSAIGMQDPSRMRVPGTVGTIPRAAKPGLTTPPPDASGRWRANKTGYYVQAIDGSPEQGGIWVPAESVWVRKRRRNSLNPRALDRALSRVTSAKKAARKLGRVTIRSAVCN